MLDTRQYDRLGRFLDGEAKALSGDELAAAAEIRDCEQAIASTMGVAVPPGAMDRIRRRMLAGMEQQAVRAPLAENKPRRRPMLRLLVTGAASAAAAAAVLIAVVAFWNGQKPMQPDANPIVIDSGKPEIIQPAVLPARLTNFDKELDSLASEISSVEKMLMMPAPPEMPHGEPAAPPDTPVSL